MKRLCVSFGKSTSLRDGIGEYSEQLGRRLASVATQLRDRHGVELMFHMHPSLHGRYGPEVGYLAADGWQRWRATSGPACDLWHRLDHFNRLHPTAGTRACAVTIHDLNFVYAKSGLSLFRGKMRVRRALSRNQHIVTISRYARDDLAARFGLEQPVDVVHNGARSLVLSCGRSPIPVLEDAPFLFHLSRMSPSKNTRAVVELARAWPQMRFVLAGPSRSDSLQLRDELARAPLANLRLLLDISDDQKAWLYEHCAGFLFPSLTEGFGLPPIEAMHFGRPVFVSDRTCLPEIGGDAAYYLTHFDPAAMRAVIEPGIDPALAAQRADHVRAHAAQYTWERAAAGYLALYGQWLGLDFSKLTQHV